MPTDRIHRGLEGIPLEYFPIWEETLGYERGLPHFRQLPEFLEEGVLIPTPGAGGYTYVLHRRTVLPSRARSQSSSSLTRQVEVEDNSSSPMMLPLFRNDDEIGDPGHPTLSWTSVQSNSSVLYQPPSEGSSLGGYNSLNLPQPPSAFYEDQYLNFVCQNPAEQSVHEEHANFQTIFPPGMDIASDPTSAPRHMQWDPPPHDGSMISVQPGVQMTDMFWFDLS